MRTNGRSAAGAGWSFHISRKTGCPCTSETMLRMWALCRMTGISFAMGALSLESPPMVVWPGRTKTMVQADRTVKHDSSHADEPPIVERLGGRAGA